MATKLWDKGFEPDKMIEEYTVGNDRELDMRLARYDVQGSLAHIAMLLLQFLHADLAERLYIRAVPAGLQLFLLAVSQVFAESSL